MEIGLKYFPGTLKRFMADPRFGEVLKLIDFVELTAVRGEDIAGFEDFPKPITIHCMHSYPGFMFNPANPSKKQENRSLLETAIQAADTLGSDIIVVHTGVKESGSSLEEAGRFLKGFRDGRIRMENMPFKDWGFELMGNNPEEIRQLIEMTGHGFCLDLAHSAESCHFHGKGETLFTEEYLKLKPDYFHFSDTVLKEPGYSSYHKHLGEGHLDMKKMLRLLPEQARVCLEVPLDLDGRIRDIKILRGKEKV